MIEFSTPSSVHRENSMNGLIFLDPKKDLGLRKIFRIVVHFTGFDHISLGFSVCLSLPDVELHVPFGFIRAGWEFDYKSMHRAMEAKPMEGPDD